MRKTAWFAAAWALLVSAGCDNLSAPPPNPYMPPPGAAAAAAPARSHKLNRAFMEEMFNYAANIHDTMRRYRDALLAMPRDSNDFPGRRSQLLSQDEEWRHLLYIRQEWLKAGNFDNNHPSRKIGHAVYNLIEESYHLDNVFLHGDTLDPKYAQATDDALREAAKSLVNYQDPPGQ